MRTILPLFVGLVCIGQLMAQENTFLKRDYWKANPSIEQIGKSIDQGHDITELNKNMFDPVCYAIMEKVDNVTIRHLISKKGNEVDKITHDGRTYIFWAAYKGNLDLMKWLVSQGAKANIEDSHGYSVMNFAAVTGQTDLELYDFLLANKANINATNHEGANALLLVAPFAKDSKILDYFVEKGQELKSVDANGSGLFHYVAKGGNVEMLKKLIAKGVDSKIVNSKGQNAITMAAAGTRRRQNDKAVFEYLRGIGLGYLVDNEGKTPLHKIARNNKNPDLFEYFLSEGLDVNLQDKDGQTPFMIAATRNEPAIVELLGEHIKNINLKDKKGRTALSRAIEDNQPEVVDYLLKKGAKINGVDNKNNTLAYYWIEGLNWREGTDFKAKMEILKTAGLDFRAKQNGGNSLLHLAAQKNDLRLMKHLQEFGIDVNQRNDEGATALHLAALSANDTGILEYLIDQGADVSIKTDFGESVFDLAKENEKLEGKIDSLSFLKLRP